MHSSIPFCETMCYHSGLSGGIFTAMSSILIHIV
jgi:hypothetical protein